MKNSVNTDKVTRLELVDHTPCTSCNGHGQWENGNECGACAGSGVKGRSVIFWDPNKKISLSLQDDEKTLKVFIDEKNPTD